MNHKIQPRLAFIFALLSVFLGRLGLYLATLNNNTSPVWPLTGFSLFILIYYGQQYLPVIFISSFAINYSVSTPGFVTTIIALGNTLEPLIGLYIYKIILQSEEDKNSFKSILAVFLASLIGSLVSATFGSSALFYGHIISENDFKNTFITWWTGNFIGGIMFLPIFSSFKSKRKFTLTLVDLLLLLISAFTTFAIFNFDFGYNFIYVILYLVLISTHARSKNTAPILLVIIYFISI